MTTSDSELINEVRQFTGYTDANTFTDSDLQSLVDTAKEEIRAHLGLPNLSFYQRGIVNTYQADRALFWFTCIGIQYRTGELGGSGLEIDELVSQPRDGTYNEWFDNFERHLSNAAVTVVSQLTNASRSRQIERQDDRTYGQ